MMDRRTFIGAAVALLGTALAAEAQPAKPRIGFLSNGNPTTEALTGILRRDADPYT
jgi:hypothetical protein